MIGLKNIFFYFLVMSAILFSSCAEKNYPVATVSSKGLQVHQAFIQKEIPGQQDGKVKTYLNFILKNESSIKMVAVTFRGKKYNLNPDENVLKIELDNSQSKTVKTKTNLDEALVEVLNGSKSKSFLIKNIQTKEDLYLP